MADGEVVIDTSVKTAQAEKGYRRLISAMEKVEREIELLSQTSQNQDLANSLDFARQKTDELSAKLVKLNEQKAALETKMELMGASPAANKELSRINSEITKTSGAFDLWVNKQDAAENKLNSYSAKQNSKLEGLKSKYKSLSSELETLINKQNTSGTAAEKGGSKTAKAADTASKSFNRLSMRMRQIVSSALVFNLISSGLRMFTQYIGRALKSNAQFQQALSKLQGSLLTAFQPIWELIVPGLIWLINILAAAANWLAKFTSLLSGKSVSSSSKSAKALNSQAGSMENLKEKTEETSNATASFDELNQIDKPDKGSSGGGGGGISATTPTFDTGIKTDNAWSDVLLRGLEALSRIITVVGTGFKYFYDAVLGPLLERLKELGLGALTWVVEKLGVLAAWMEENSDKVAQFITIIGTIALVAAAVFGAYKAFGLLKIVLKAVFGFLTSGVGIILIIIGALTAIVVATGNGQVAIEALMNILNGFLTFVEGIFTGNMDLAMQGLGQMFQGLLDLCIIIFDSLDIAFAACLDWIVDKLGITNGTILGLVDGLKQIFHGITEFLSGVFSGDWKRTWDGLVGIFKGIINIMISSFEGFLNLIPMGLNWLIDQVNKLSFDIPNWSLFGDYAGKKFGFNFGHIGSFNIPRLATGAVIPPNREFMAVLGDQKHGTNIETPEGLLRQIFREENNGGYNDRLLMEMISILCEIRDNGGDIRIGDDVIGRAARRFENSVGININGKFADAY